MCGICGIVDFNNEYIKQDILLNMIATMRHRGPDNCGIYRKSNILLGHSRLSIIDISHSGNQPMSNEDKTIWLSFNGEIYDYKQHRLKLIRDGHIFKSNTDSEVIIHLYEEYGIDCVKKLNGQFAFAIWDNNKKELYFARDRVGIKPLYYYYDNNCLIFGSELKSILKVPNISKDLDWESLDLYLTLNYIPCPRTIFKDIKKLEPANYLTFGKDKFSIKKYWDVLDNTNQTSSLYSLLNQSVKKRMIADVPIGAFLSGGIDSSIIVGLMTNHTSIPVRTFSIGYEDLPNFDETKYSREVAEYNKTDHIEFSLTTKDIINDIMNVLESIDEPFADSSIIPTYILSKRVKDHAKVALSGDGGDELFGGYKMYQAEKYINYYQMLPKFIRNNIGRTLSLLPDDRNIFEFNRKLKRFFDNCNGSFIDRYCSLRKIFSNDLRKQLTGYCYKNLYSKEINKIVGNEFNIDIINLILYLDFTGLLHNDMLTKVDRMSMANSLEVRVPMLDHTVAEYAFTLNGNDKIRGKQGKFHLINQFKNIIPSSVYNRNKMGFEIPLNIWLRNELKYLVDTFLDSKLIKSIGIFNYKTVKEIIDKHMSGKFDMSWQLWNLIVFQYWYERYM